MNGKDGVIVFFFPLSKDKVYQTDGWADFFCGTDACKYWPGYIILSCGGVYWKTNECVSVSAALQGSVTSWLLFE